MSPDEALSTCPICKGDSVVFMDERTDGYNRRPTCPTCGGRGKVPTAQAVKVAAVGAPPLSPEDQITAPQWVVGSWIENAYREGWCDGGNQALPDERSLLERDWRRSVAKSAAESHLPYLHRPTASVEAGPSRGADAPLAPEGATMGEDAGEFARVHGAWVSAKAELRTLRGEFAAAIARAERAERDPEQVSLAFKHERESRAAAEAQAAELRDALRIVVSKAPAPGGSSGEA